MTARNLLLRIAFHGRRHRPLHWLILGRRCPMSERLRLVF